MDSSPFSETLDALADTMRAFSLDTDPVRSVTQFTSAVRRSQGDQCIISVSRRGVPPGHYRIARLLHQSNLDPAEYPSTEFAGHDAPAHQGGLIGQILEAGRPAVFRRLHVPNDPIMGRHLAPYRTLVAVPVYDAGDATNWVLFAHTDDDAWEDSYIEMRMMQANLMGSIANSKRIMAELLDAARLIRREIEEIASIQRGLLPGELPNANEIELAAYYQTFDRAGGDFYAVYPVANGTEGAQGLLIADASGHGPSAAVVVAMLAVLLDTTETAMRTPARLLHYLNEQLFRRPINHSFVTAFAAVLDPVSGRLRYASAGHPPPLVRKPDGGVHELEHVGGLPLAVFGDRPYDEGEYILESGDALLLYTDGLTDAANPDGAMVGDAGLAAALAAADGSAEAMAESIRLAIQRFAAGVRPRDDQTMLIVRRR